eukprot:m.91388 g.91388  ORF g.91388 m.91388 type:complete len:680 (-) comp20181_c0_seq7:43-2082(-)
MSKKAKVAVGGPVRVPRLNPPRETIFEGTPITITPHHPSETVLYTIDAPHDYKISPFATKSEKAGRLKYYRRPFFLSPGIHRVAALSFSRSNPFAAPSPCIRRTFRVHPHDSPANPAPIQQSAAAVSANPDQPTVSKIPCEFILLVDQSGSMRGLTFERIREAVKVIVRKCPEDSRINVVGYGETAFPMWPRSVQGTPENCVTILDYASGMSTSQGSTRLAEALRAVIAPAPPDPTTPSTTAATTARIHSSRAAATAIKRIPGYDRQLIVLSDGELQDYDETAKVLQDNPHERRLWLLIFGDRANRVLLNKLADLGNGGTEFVLSTNPSIRPAVLKMLDRAQQRPERLISLAMSGLDKAMARLDTAKLKPQIVERSVAAMATVLWNSAAVTFDATALSNALRDCSADLETSTKIDITAALQHNGRTALHLAASKGEISVAATLLEHPAGTAMASVADPGGRTPLHWAAWNGNLVMVRLLAEKGLAATACLDKDDLTPAFLARQEGHIDVADYLESTAGRTHLHHAAWNNDVAAATAIVEPTGPPLGDPYLTAREQVVHDEAVARKSALVDPLDARGLSAIFLAIAQGSRGVASLLTKHRAVGAADARKFLAGGPGWTALHWAAYQGSTEWCRHLVSVGTEADLKSRAHRGLTPAEVAENRGRSAAAAARLLRAAEGTPS